MRDIAGADQYPRTPDGRYFVVRGRLWRCSDPSLSTDDREQLVSDLMTARRHVGAAKSSSDVEAMATARRAVDDAKHALGERGPVWWTDAAPDYNRHLAKNTPYADWFANLDTHGEWIFIDQLARVPHLFSLGTVKTESSRNALARIETLDQAVAQNVNLRVTCKLCARTRVVPPAPLEGLARLRRWPVNLIPLSCKLRCGTCGGKSVELKATTDRTDGPAIGPTTEREWQALVRRLRD